MKKSDSFLEFVMDQLVGMRDVTYRAMFGGYGLYNGEAFFAIIAAKRLYFKTNEETRGKYIDMRTGPFRPNKKQTLKNYYEVPVDIMEDSDELVGWALEAVRIQGKKGKNNRDCHQRELH